MKTEPPPSSRQTVSIPADGVRLDGDLQIPPGAAAIVVFVHGSGSSRHSPRNQYVARILREAGLATLLFDLLTKQEEAQDEFTRHFRFDINLLTRRLLEVARWLRLHPGTASLPLAFFGASTGAAAALAAAAHLGEQVSAVVSRGGRPDLAGAALQQVHCPVLLIVGGHDDVVLQLTEEALEHLPGDKALRIVANASHLFEERGALEQVAQLAAHWFRTHIPAPASEGEFS